MSKKKPSKFFHRMEVAAQQLAEMAIESNGTSVLFISTEKEGEGRKYVTQCQGDTEGIISGLIAFATDPETAPIFNQVLTNLNKQ